MKIEELLYEEWDASLDVYAEYPKCKKTYNSKEIFWAISNIYWNEEKKVCEKEPTLREIRTTHEILCIECDVQLEVMFGGGG